MRNELVKEIKYCKDCFFLKRKWFLFYSCDYPDKPRSFLNGNLIAKNFWCWDERTDEHRCGKEAKNFEWRTK